MGRPPSKETLRMRAVVLSELSSGVKTTEQLRFACAEVMPVVYKILAGLRAEGVVQSSKPKKQSESSKWRLAPSGRPGV